MIAVGDAARVHRRGNLRRAGSYLASVFGLGFVSELIGQNKIEVSFQHDKRILIHNRRMRLCIRFCGSARKQKRRPEATTSRVAATETRECRSRLIKPPDLLPDRRSLSWMRSSFPRSTSTRFLT